MERIDAKLRRRSEMRTMFLGLAVVFLASGASAEPRCWWDGYAMRCASEEHPREWRERERRHEEWRRERDRHEWCYEHPGRC